MHKIRKYLTLPFVALLIGCNNDNMENNTYKSNLQKSQKEITYEIFEENVSNPKIEDWIRGDFNNDGEANIKDVIAITRYRKFGDESPYYAHAVDMNLDGAIDKKDAVILSERLFNHEIYEAWVNKAQSDIFRFRIEY